LRRGEEEEDESDEREADEDESELDVDDEALVVERWETRSASYKGLGHHGTASGVHCAEEVDDGSGQRAGVSTTCDGSSRRVTVHWVSASMTKTCRFARSTAATNKTVVVLFLTPPLVP
jgi:hypothetical protein